MAPFTLTVPSELRMLSVVRAFVEAVCRTGELDRAATHAIVLVTGEAASNVIRHAHPNRPELPLQVSCRLGPETMEVQIIDEGKPFHLDTVPHLDPGEMRVGGRGVFLMRTLMDELSCEPRPNGGNVLRMLKRWAASAQVRECG